MAISFALLSANKYQLVYRASQDGAAGAEQLITNRDAAGIAGADLRLDSRGAVGGFGVGGAIFEMVSTPTVDDAAAKALLISGIGRVLITIEQRSAPANVADRQVWAANILEGGGDPASAGFAVIAIAGPDVGPASAIVRVQRQHSYTNE